MYASISGIDSSFRARGKTGSVGLRVGSCKSDTGPEVMGESHCGQIAGSSGDGGLKAPGKGEKSLPEGIIHHA